jgi:methylaspartate ammonia-lyase
MVQQPLITSLLTLSAPGPLFQTPQGLRPREMALVGLSVAGKGMVWGDCLPTAEHAPSFHAEAERHTLETAVWPRLENQPLTSFRALMAAIEALTETVTLDEAAPEPFPGPRQLSRRALFGGLLNPAGQRNGQPPMRTITVERPIHPALRDGLSQALLAAVALARGQQEVEVVAQEYGLLQPTAAVPLHLEAGHLPPAHIAHYPAASLGYTTGVGNDEAEFGDNGARLQRRVRDWQAQIKAIAPPDNLPTICIDVRGGLGRLFANDAGKILGAVHGLETAARPCALCLANVFSLPDRVQHIEALGRLKEYMRFRRLTTQLVVADGVENADDAQAFIQAGAADMVRLDAARLGGLHQAVEAALVCRQHGVAVWLDGRDSVPGPAARLLAHVALAVQPALVSAGDDAGLVGLHNEMSRILAALRLQSGSAGE